MPVAICNVVAICYCILNRKETTKMVKRITPTKATGRAQWGRIKTLQYLCKIMDLIGNLFDN